jgi:predicted DNA-binding transcriptional regulator AlpA
MVRTDLVALSEIARMARVSRQAVGNWRARHADFPQPRALINSAPAFSRIEVEAWMGRRRIEFSQVGGDLMAREVRRPVRVLRQFQYCDQDLVRDFLAQVEGGVYEGEDVTETSQGSKKVGGGVSAGPLNMNAGADRGITRGNARHVAQVMASEFQRLYSVLDEDGMITPLDAFDDAIWEQVQASEVVEVPVEMRLPGFHQIAQIAAEFGKMMPLLQMGGVAPDMPAANADMMRMMGELHAASEAGPLTVIATATGNSKVKFLCRLKREHVQADPQVLEGEATILAKIQRKIRRGEHASAIDIPAFRGLSNKKRREFDKIFDKPKIEGFDVGESTVPYPGAVLTVVAVYR